MPGAASGARGVAGGIEGCGGWWPVVRCGLPFHWSTALPVQGDSQKSRLSPLPSPPVPRRWPRPLGPPPGGSVLNVQGGTRAALGRKPGLARASSPPKHSSQAGGEARPWLREPLGCYSDTLFSSDGKRETRVLIPATFTKGGRDT